MSVYSLCDPALWDKARWSGTMFAHDPSGIGPPLMGLSFKDVDAGKEIFRSFRNHVGLNDKAGLIRVSIVEGDIKGMEPGYSVVVGWEPNKAVGAERAAGVAGSRYVLCITRTNRMNPAPGSTLLQKFKEEFAKHGQFKFMPAGGTEQRPVPIFELAIEKYTVNFKRTDSLTRQDIEHCVFGEDWISPDIKPG